MVPQTRSAIVVKAPGSADVVADLPLPGLAAGDILVRTTTFALNPVDQAFVDYMPQLGTVLGCDYAGVVDKIGDEVDPGWKEGTRVAGYVHGSKCAQSSRFC